MKKKTTMLYSEKKNQLRKLAKKNYYFLKGIEK
jgi:hypothetical protein